MKARWLIAALVALIGATGFVGSAPARSRHASVSAAPVLFWSNEARRAIVPPTAGPENFGNKFPGEAAVYMGIVHVAIYDAAVALEGGTGRTYRPDARRRTPRLRPRSPPQRTTR